MNKGHIHTVSLCTWEYNVYPEYGFSGSVVATLMDDLFDQGHILYIDNWYSSSTIFKTLLAKSFKSIKMLKLLFN